MLYILITIIISIAVLGAIVICMLLKSWLDGSKNLKLKKYRSKEEGLADLLNYAAMIDDGIIVCKNGSLMASWIYKGIDLDSADIYDREEVSIRINQAIRELRSGWMFHVDAARYPAPSYPDAYLSDFPEPISQAIDNERRKFFNELDVLYEGYFILTVTYMPSHLSEQKLAEMMFDDETEKFSETENQDKLILKFKRDIAKLEDNLSNASLDMRRLKSYKTVNEDGSETVYDDFLRWLNQCVTGKSHNIILPKNPIYLDSLIGGQEFYTGIIPKIGKNYIQVIAIDGFPLESYPAILSKVAEFPIEYRWSNRFIFLDQHQAVAEIDKYKRKWKQKIRGIISQMFNTASTSVNLDAVNMVNDAELAIAEVNSGEMNQGYYTSVIILMNEDRAFLDSTANEVSKEINGLGFSTRIETVNTVEAFLGSLPSHGVENLRRPMISTANFADFMPMNSIWTGSAVCECPFYPAGSPPLMQVVTHGASPFRLNLHVDDVGHTMMFGPTGAGKSVHFGVLAVQYLRYKGMQIFAFDKGHSMETLTYAVGGTHYSIGDSITDSEGTTKSFCPMSLIKSPSSFSWFITWIESVVNLNGQPFTPKQRNEVEDAVKSILYNKEDKTQANMSLSDLVNSIQDINLREVLKTYTLDGAMGYLLDGAMDDLEFSNFTCFELEQLMSLGEKYCLPVLTYIFRKIEDSLDGSPTVIFLDEAWTMLGHESFREKIKKWLKEMRKKNCIVVMATQSLSDAANSGILDIINESCMTKIFLPNNKARDEDYQLLYKTMGLNTTQIDIVSKAIKKKQYYYTSPRGNRLYDLALGRLTLAFTAVSDPSELKKVHAYINQYGNSWTIEYLKEKNIDLNKYVNLEDFKHERTI